MIGYWPKRPFMHQKNWVLLWTDSFIRWITLGSMKNLWIPQNKTWLLQLLENIKRVVKRLRWKVLCNGKKETNVIKTERYGLKSSKTLKQVKDSIPFENDLIALVQNIRFRKTRNHFQKKIPKDIQLIQLIIISNSHFRTTILYWLI